MRNLGDEMKDARNKSKKALGNSKGLADLKKGKKTGTMSNVDKNTNNWFK